MREWWDFWNPFVKLFGMVAFVCGILAMVAFNRQWAVAQAIDRGHEQALRRLILEQAVRYPCPVERWTW